MWRPTQKANKDRVPQTRTEQGVVRKLAQANEEAIRDICRFWVPVEKDPGCEPPPDKTEKHEACGFSYIMSEVTAKRTAPASTKAKTQPISFLVEISQKERWLRSLMADKKPLVMTPADWQKHKNAPDCHICGKRNVLRFYFCAWLQFWPILWPKPQKMLLFGNERNKPYWTTKRKERKRSPWPVDCKKSGNMSVLCRIFAGTKL